jgi:hypothetical protein
MLLLSDYYNLYSISTMIIDNNLNNQDYFLIEWFIGDTISITNAFAKSI